MKRFKQFLSCISRVVQGSSAVQNSIPNATAAISGPEPSLKSPAAAAIRPSSNGDDQPWGLKLLYEGQESIVDIVAVHGLNGHREGTWTADNNILWLRDLLPSELPNARIWTWGYDSRTQTGDYEKKWRAGTLYGHGKKLLYELDSKRWEDGTQQRPIIFIAHDVGGVVVKNALLHSNRIGEGVFEWRRSIKTSTYGIIFMCVPQQDYEIGEILLNIAKMQGHTSDNPLSYQEDNCELPFQHAYAFTSISRDFEIKFAYETLPTPTFAGKAIEIVPRRSAVIPGLPDAAEFGINQDHWRMTKFSSADNQDFKKLYRALVAMTKKASSRIERNWQLEPSERPNL